MPRAQDIEDVLASIRRLVANEGPAERRAMKGPALLLGEAQRVAEPGETSETIHDRARDDDDAAEASETSDIWTRAPEAFDLPHDPAEDADSETSEERLFAEVTPRPATGSPGERTPEKGTDPSAPLILSSDTRDDDALRALIARMLREELAGELGEQIASHVRQIVRREIRHMLASGELD